MFRNVDTTVARAETVRTGALALTPSGPLRVHVIATGPANGNPEFGMQVQPVPVGVAVSSRPAGNVSVTVIVFVPATATGPTLRTVSV